MKNTLWYKNKLYCCGSKTAAVSSSCLLQPETEAEAGAGGEGTSAAAVKRGLSLETAAAGQDVKRFRTAAGAASTVTYNPPPPAYSPKNPSETCEMWRQAPV